MIKTLVIFTAIMALVAIVYGTAIGINIVSADGEFRGLASAPNVHDVHNPQNAHHIIYGQSIIADNFYHHNGNYDIQYDGTTCMRWLTDYMPVVIANPTIITYTDPIDDFDLLRIIACEA